MFIFAIGGRLFGRRAGDVTRRAGRHATCSSRHVARAASEETPADREDEDEEEVGMDDLVELEMGGVSVSPRGFVALLVPKGSSRSIPRAPNPVEDLRDAEPAVPLGPCLLYTSPSPRDMRRSRMPSSA